MNQIAAKQVHIIDPYWVPRLKINAEVAIYHQWEQLEKTGCIENFRLVAGSVNGFREGFFFADSDAYKWLDAAARVYALKPSKRLKELMDNFIGLIMRAQSDDGYIYTYNQLHFPEVRWMNLQIEHELYCHGHLIEAGVSHFKATGECSLLKISSKAADLLVTDFAGASPERTPGHQEIEIALIRLFKITQNQDYLDLAEQFVEQRGRIKGFLGHIFTQNKSVETRAQLVEECRASYVAAHPEHVNQFQLPPDNSSEKPVFGKTRWLFNTGTGKYFQQHKPVREQTIPVGHAVRFTYMETAIAMLYQHKSDGTLLDTMAKAWEHMVTRRMYVTGGIGSLPNIEGFGRDYELDPQYSYSETCAALGCMLWNWEMTCITGQAQYADLFEWQLYNAAAVGLGQDGRSYLYNNPLTCDRGLTRTEWFKCPCCPSNISRVWADLGKFIYTFDKDQIWIHQYIGNVFSGAHGINVSLEAGLPWDGNVKIRLSMEKATECTLYCRVPSWTSDATLSINGDPMDVEEIDIGSNISIIRNNHEFELQSSSTASGYDPRQSRYFAIKRTWNPDDLLEIEFEMVLNIQSTHHKVKSTLGRVAVSYGPLVYCLESVDNPGVNIFEAQLDPGSLNIEIDNKLFGGITVICALTTDQRPLTFIPYYLWANRGESMMTVYVRV